MENRTATLTNSIATLALGAFATTLAIYFKAFETFWDWSRRHEVWETEKLVSVLVILLCALSVFFWRKHGRELAERKALEKRLRHQALHDPLTNMANRALFTDRLQHAVARTQRRAEKVAVMLIDLDDFKTVNDSLGHEAGDRLLVEVAERLNSCVRPGDTVARLGGDEFALLIEGSPEGTNQAASQVAKRVMGALARPVSLGSKEVFVRPSIGIAIGSAEQHAEDLLRDADVAMYAAKGRGKGRYEFYEAGMHEAVLERLELRADLKRVIENEEVVVHYQPIVALGRAPGAEAKIHEVEALLRWKHPEKGLIPPDQFISLAEETGDIVQIGLLVLEEACHQVQRWRESDPDKAHLTLSINLSARQFRQPELGEQVSEVLRKTGLPARFLKLEITESAAMEDADAAISALRRLKELGIKVAIDDFGTGYSSLSQLGRFPADTVKLDRSFVSRLEVDPESAAIISTTVTLAQKLGLSVTAEGVETTGQLARLRELGCDLVQGYYFARPMPPEEVLRFTVPDTLLAGEKAAARSHGGMSL